MFTAIKLCNMKTLRLLSPLCTKFHVHLTKAISAGYCTHPLKYIEAQEKWRLKDDVSKRWELIYKAPMQNVMNWITTYLTVTTGMFACAGVYFTLFSLSRDFNQPILLLDSDIVLADNIQECLIYLGAFVLINIGVKRVLSKFVLRMYKNGDKYLAIYQGHFYKLTTKHEFHLNDFKKLSPTLVVSWGDSRYSLGQRHAIILDRYFKTPALFNKLLYKKTRVDFE